MTGGGRDDLKSQSLARFNKSNISRLHTCTSTVIVTLEVTWLINRLIDMVSTFFKERRKKNITKNVIYNCLKPFKTRKLLVLSIISPQFDYDCHVHGGLSDGHEKIYLKSRVEVAFSCFPETVFLRRIPLPIL